MRALAKEDNPQIGVVSGHIYEISYIITSTDLVSVKVKDKKYIDYLNNYQILSNGKNNNKKHGVFSSILERIRDFKR